MKKIQFHRNRTLKLTNVLKFKILVDEKDFDFNVSIEQIQSYIKTKGAIQVGPLIQYTKTFMNNENQLDMEIIMMLQCNKYIHNVGLPYFMESVIRVPNAMYCRYCGKESTLKYAYDKIYLEAFEEGVELEDYNYTVFVSSNEEDETIVADVFVPQKEK